MAKYRQLYTEFWNDNFVLNLEPEEKYFYIYLLTNPNTSQCGIYELPKKIIEMQTGHSKETVDRLLKKFEEYKKIIYSEETNEVIILNWVKYNEPNNINAIKCVNKEIKKIKNRNFVKELYLQYSKIGLEVDKLFSDVKNSFISMDKNNKCENELKDTDKNNKDEELFINSHAYNYTEDNFIDSNIDNKREEGYPNIDNKSEVDFIVRDENQYSCKRGDINNKLEDSFINVNIDNKVQDNFIDIDKNYEMQDRYKDINRGHEGAYKGLVSKEIISNKEKIINNKQEVISNSCCSNKQEESKYNNTPQNNNCEFKKQEGFESDEYNHMLKNNDFKKHVNIGTTAAENKTTATTTDLGVAVSCRANFKNIKDILAIFESNIHKVVPMEERKIIGWGNKFSYDMIVMAIEEAIVNNIKNIGYIEKILNTWFSKGLASIEDIEDYKSQWAEKKNKMNSKENSVDPWNYDGQREYDFEKLERKLLGWQIA
ncbi:DnaD domain protein [Clostridium sporogenes]|uniref:DnaD domain-containing protein n=1 Tax=Clostridium sporogenes TaxID=1509 RepID=UPI000E191B0A|nr:DnaD domain protein [Clostridium sporogenes]MDU6334537.1 DnaD domain protein [Clostridium sporogenes]NFQ84005.1 DnaD domain protein [Clostridium sporogenes]SUY64453.1 dnaD protein [Clostridium sporogenes]